MINCTETPDFCQFFEMKKVPSFLFLNGPDPYYWEINLNKKVWKYFIDKKVNGKILYASNSNEVAAAIANTIKGFSTFQLVVKSSLDPFINKMQNITSIYQKLGPTFIYSVDITVPEPLLYIYRSLRCNTSIRISNLDDDELKDIVYQNYRSHFKHYNTYEFMENLHDRESFLLYLKDENLQNSSLTDKFLDVSGKYCDKFNLGWNGALNEENLLGKFGFKEPINATFLYVNPNTKCSHLIDIKKDSVEILKEINEVVSSKKCNK